MSEDQGAAPDGLGAGPTGPTGEPGPPGPEMPEMPAAPAPEVSPPPRPPKRKKFRYVVRAAAAHFHVFEESTGTRVTQHALPSEQQAQDLADRWTDTQTPPR